MGGVSINTKSLFVNLMNMAFDEIKILNRKYISKKKYSLLLSIMYYE